MFLGGGLLALRRKETWTMKRHRLGLTLPLILLGGLLVALPAWAQELYVANALANTVTVYSRTASGDTAAPLRTLGPAGRPS